jgi:hypothetical protein
MNLLELNQVSFSYPGGRPVIGEIGFQEGRYKLFRLENGRLIQ